MIRIGFRALVAPLLALGAALTTLSSCSGEVQPLEKGGNEALSTISCPPGYFDMVDWMTMDTDVANQFYLMGTDRATYLSSIQIGDNNSGNIWNLKYPDNRSWDNYQYNANTIYQGYTTLSDGVNDPATHLGGPLSQKQWPYVPRCATNGSFFNTKAPIYAIITDCKLDNSINNSPYGNGLTGNGYSRTMVYDVGSINWGGSIGSLPSIVVSRPYQCDINFQNCQVLEEAYYTQRYGLVHWNYYETVNGSYQLRAGSRTTRSCPRRRGNRSLDARTCSRTSHSENQPPEMRQGLAT
jgi:hypothetical protein